MRAFLKPAAYAFVISASLLQALSFPVNAMLLTSPPSITPEEVEGRAHILSLSMHWEAKDKKSSLGFERKNGKTTMKIQLTEEFPSELIDFENRFTCSVPQEKKVWTFLHEDTGSDTSLPSAVAPSSIEDIMGMVHSRRELEHQTPQAVTLQEIAGSIRNKQCVFYTGAGISARAVPTMDQLMKSLQLDGCKENKEKFFVTLQNALKNSTAYVQPMDDFYNACFYGQPTQAHFAVRDIVQQKKWGLLTENLDLLHQRSGIDPLHHNGTNWLKSNVSETDLKKVDYVLTVGLASDESGLLGWYKKVNPEGRIIAINLQQPNYLDDKDLLIIGDVQQLLPLLCKGLR